MSLRLVLLHGFTGGPSSWNAVRALLPPDVDVATPALVGHRGGAAPLVTDFESEVDRLAALLGSDGRPAHLTGYSLGGRLALGLLVRHPSLFAGATLIGAQPGLVTAGERAERAALDERWRRLLLEHGIQAFVAEWEQVPLFRTQASLPRELLDRQTALRLGHDAAGLAHSLAATGLAGMPSYWDDLAGIRIPTTLMVGERDAKFGAIARRMTEKCPSASLEVVAGAGHNVPLERPDAVASALLHALGVAA